MYIPGLANVDDVDSIRASLYRGSAWRSRHICRNQKTRGCAAKLKRFVAGVYLPEIWLHAVRKLALSHPIYNGAKEPHTEPEDSWIQSGIEH